MASRLKIRARYSVKGPRKEKVSWKKYRIDETGSLQFDEVTEEREVYWVYFPQGHSIRVTSFERLQEMGYHLKPRMVDMNTGDVIEIGGDPYDFASGNEIEPEIIAEEYEIPISVKKTRHAQAA